MHSQSLTSERPARSSQAGAIRGPGICVNRSAFSPLTPALSPLRGEGEARGRFVGRVATGLEACATVVLLLACALLAWPAAAQTNFNSGSDGSYGALNITSDTTLDLPTNGIFNCTTI